MSPLCRRHGHVRSRCGAGSAVSARAVRLSPNKRLKVAGGWRSSSAAYVYTPDPDALAEEFTSRGVSFREPLGNNSDQLHGFEVMDADG